MGNMQAAVEAINQKRRPGGPVDVCVGEWVCNVVVAALHAYDDEPEWQKRVRREVLKEAIGEQTHKETNVAIAKLLPSTKEVDAEHRVAVSVSGYCGDASELAAKVRELIGDEQASAPDFIKGHWYADSEGEWFRVFDTPGFATDYIRAEWQGGQKFVMSPSSKKACQCRELTTTEMFRPGAEVRYTGAKGTATGRVSTLHDQDHGEAYAEYLTVELDNDGSLLSTIKVRRDRCELLEPAPKEKKE